MVAPFDYFIILAEMRTGSNFLEVNINTFERLACYGEAFNPHFICYPKAKDLFGVTQAQRENDPESLIRLMQKNTDGLPGFRFFHNHDPRIAKLALADKRCAKIVLTRNILESFVSWKIAVETGQWKLTNAKHLRTAQIQFDAEEFENYVDRVEQFQAHVRKSLQVTGQAAFFLDYEDLSDVQVMNGLANFLGQSDQLRTLDSTLKKQNPVPLGEKVKNLEDLERSLARIDSFGLGRVPMFEPTRGAAVPTYLTAAKAPLLFMPIRSGPEQQVVAWLADLDAGDKAALHSGFNQKSLRQWTRKHRNHRCFSVVRHPLLRAHTAFCQHILPCETGNFADIRKTLRKTFKLPLPGQKIGPDYGIAEHRTAFLSFLKFLKLNLNGQTSVRVDAHWASQYLVLQAMASVQSPDLVLREEELAEGLAFLAQAVGFVSPDLTPELITSPFELHEIYDEELEAAARDVYQRDYLAFGFGPWKR